MKEGRKRAGRRDGGKKETTVLIFIRLYNPIFIGVLI